MFSANTTQVSGGYQISRSLRFNSADSARLNRTFSTNGTSRTTCTISFWVKLSSMSTSEARIIDCYDGSGSDSSGIYYDSNKFTVKFGGSTTTQVVTTAVYRDPSAWYHLCAVFDSTQATSTDRIKFYVNGVQVTSFSSASYPNLNQTYVYMSSGVRNYIGDGWNAPGTLLFNGYLTEFFYIDGQALTPSSFGQTDAQTGVWTPIAYSGSYGTNGFYLNFSDNSNTTAATLGKDYSGNGNNWTPNNFSVTAGAGNDSLVDSPTSYGTDTGVGGTVRGNYATLNPLIKPVGTVAYSNGNLEATNSTANWNAIGGTIGISTGKWYWEYISGGQNTFFGIQVPSINFSSGNPQDSNAAAGSVLLCDDNQYQIDYNARVAYTSTSHPSGTVVGVAVDMDAGTIVFYLNGTSQGSITWTSSAAYGKTVIPMAIAYNSGYVTTANFGQRPFAYTAPSGYKALCTQNLPTPTIGATTATQAGKYFNPVLYTGNSSTNAITGVGFQPDLTWFKRRDAAYANVLQNSATGVTKYLVSNTTDAEGTYSGYIQSWNSDGFTLGSGDNASNNSGSTYVAWNWKANGSGSTNTAGSITSTVSVNTTSGFSIVTFTGTNANATVGHGLGVAPAMVIMKNRAALDSWQVYHSSLPSAAYRLQLNSSAAADSQPTVWNSTAPTSTVFSVGTNVGNYTQIAYCFAPVSGYSSFGSWTGNGSSTGPFIYTGFRPALVLVKNTTSAGPQWWILDNKRNTYNPEDLALPPSLAYAEQTIPTCLNFLSNGFQITTTNGDFNTNGSNYIYMAIAETPLKFSLAR